MTRDERFIPALPPGIVIVFAIAQLILLVSLAPAVWSQPIQDKAEDPFIAQHRQAVKKNPEGVSFTLGETPRTFTAR